MRCAVPAALLALLLLCQASPAGAQSGESRLCRVANAITSSGQVKDRLKKCREGDIVVVLVAVQSVPLAEVAARACDFAGQVLLDATTDAIGIGRVTCLYPGSVRDRTR
ncbi:hypothetical protein [Marinimicrococcus flavescens]|uniref:Uncharacterized protein n=1 Tax=Marinimicrococcus flavescens TaxID=3031815 RepID=A0AAP3UZN7_9PROT|nr:hypothetical protein [Marinimicrococcus flavescens]